MKDTYILKEDGTWEIRGKSTREKPKDVPDSSIYYEKDTQRVFMFDLETMEWIPQ